MTPAATPLAAERLEVKLFLRQPALLSPRDLVPVWHRWIQRDLLDDVMIDVVDYSHVHQGPGVLLVCYGANYSLDQAEGEPGLLCSRKRAAPGDLPGGPDTFDARLTGAVRATLQAARHLADDPALGGRAAFRTDALLVRINDRLLAPNSDAIFGELRRPLEALAARLYPGGDAHLVHLADPAERCTVRIESGEDPGLAALVARLG